ncbi:MAG: hypothetical protein NZM29_03540, partial [Nitrospira sp.]|nr:hypothetical protein [Nitrospira sp.]
LTDSDETNNDQKPIPSSDRQGGYTMIQHGPSHLSGSGTPPPLDPQDAVRGFFDQLLHSAVKEIENRFVEIWPRMVEEALTQHIHPLVRHEVQTTVGELLSAERMASLIEPVLVQELPSLIGKEMQRSEPLIRQTALEAAERLTRETLNRWIVDQAPTIVREQVADQVRQQAVPLEQIMKDEVRFAVARHIEPQTEHLVKSLAQEVIDRSVQHVVPELAEQHIKAELRRLTDAA